MDQADRPPRAHRQPDGPGEAVEVRAAGAGTRAGAIAGRRLTFGFVQWEFAGRLGPPAGRYVVRRHAGDEVQSVVVVSEPVDVPAPPRRRRPRVVPPGPEAGPAPVTRVTVIEGEPLPDGAAWLRDADVAGALAVLRRLVAAYRVAAADPCVADPDPERALVARIGYGSGEQVADGDWEAARTLSPGRRGRSLAPDERLAALLTGRDVALASEELTLRARADVDAGRWREAALQLEAALGVALAELEAWREQRDIAARLDELAALREPVGAAAAAARVGTLEQAQTEALRKALGRLEAALRARSVAVL